MEGGWKFEGENYLTAKWFLNEYLTEAKLGAKVAKLFLQTN